MRLLALQRRNKKATLIEGGFPLLHHLSRPAGGRLWSNNSDGNTIDAGDVDCGDAANLTLDAVAIGIIEVSGRGDDSRRTVHHERQIRCCWITCPCGLYRVGLTR